MKWLRMVLLVGAGVAPALVSGCHPLSMGIFTPIPVQAWATERMEEKVCIHTDTNTPILPPIPPGYRPVCEDVPDQRTILRAMPRVCRGIPYVYEEFRDDIAITIEKLADVIDPPRFFPLIGPAQLHHCHFKCTVYFTETIQSSYPFPFKCTRRRTEVVYIDRDHLHQCAPSPETRLSVTRDLTTRP